MLLLLLLLQLIAVRPSGHMPRSQLALLTLCNNSTAVTSTLNYARTDGVVYKIYCSLKPTAKVCALNFQFICLAFAIHIPTHPALVIRRSHA